MIDTTQDRNAEALRTQSFRPRIPSALSASPRFNNFPAEHGYVLTPGRYVGAEEVEDDDVPAIYLKKHELPIEKGSHRFRIGA